jgi:hypothetical protein
MNNGTNIKIGLETVGGDAAARGVDQVSDEIREIPDAAAEAERAM